jgi:hypothetical protein
VRGLPGEVAWEKEREEVKKCPSVVGFVRLDS